jgi:exopolyphosphatase/guanosine-5'-triphosphate,3'-diphosphate pyrophosphatase
MTLLDRIAQPAPVVRIGGAAREAFARVAIIDIGSNSVRLVVYDGPRRVPFTLFNEKVMAGLGAELDATGRLGDAAMDRSLRALARFRRLCADMNVTDIRCVATAAVRDAANGAAFAEQVRDLGLPVRVLSGDEEGRASAMGVISGMPDADGIMGDLGGGSLELVRIRKGEILRSLSVPLGVLRVREIRGRGKNALAETVATALSGKAWQKDAQDLPFYMVGGSWRALARVDMLAQDYPLPIFQGYEMAPSRVPALQSLLATTDRATLKALPSLSGGRIPTLPDAAALLREIVADLKSSRLVVSAYGLREGLLFQGLPCDIASQDPLLVAARVEGDAQGRFAGHGDLIDQWIAPLFADDAPPLRRIRHAACLLADVGWRANPDFRAERGLETGLHGNWVGITPAERAMLGQALSTSLGGGYAPLSALRRLTTTDALDRAIQWGLAIRFAQRLSGGVASALESASVALEDGVIVLNLPDEDRALLGEAAERRLKQLGQAMGKSYRVA